MRYQSRRNYVEAVTTSKALARGAVALHGWLKEAFETGAVKSQGGDYDTLVIKTRNGSYLMPVGWYIVRHNDGHLEGMRPDVFEQKYETEWK